MPATARVSIKTVSPLLPAGGSGGPVTADFQSIQDNVFTPICSKCHIGASAPEGLQLDAAHSYNLLVGVPSAERPDLLRVNPGNPDTSYMVLKIEGASGIVGGQMPFGETPLPQATIDAIRQWITNGAPKAAAASAASTAHVRRADHGAARFGHRQGPGEANRGGILARARRIARQRDDGPPCTNRQPDVGRRRWRRGLVATVVPVSVGLAPHNPAVMLITPQTALERGVYRATLRGTGGGALANLNATTLGADVSFEFTVDAPR